MQITKTLERDMGHRVPNHESKCKNLHGHRYKAGITLEGDIIQEKGVSQEGMLIDFGHIKRIAGGFIDDAIDHGYMFYKGDEIGKLATEMGMKTIEVDFIPTAENIGNWLFDILSPMFVEQYGNNLKLKSIKLRETPTSFIFIEK